MYRTGDKLVYGIHGVCSVVDVEEKVVDRKQVSYLVLEPFGQNGSRYLIPTHNSAAMCKLHKILTKDELESLLVSEEVFADGWIADESRRKQTYRELICSGDRTRLLQMVHTLYCHKKRQISAGRRIHLCDDNFLRDAEKLLANEIAFVLEITQENAKNYIRSRLKEDA